MNTSWPEHPRTRRILRLAKTTLCVAAVAAVLGVGFTATPPSGFAWADDHEDGGHTDDGHGGGSGGKGRGGSGGHDDGHDEDDHDDGHDSGGPRGPGGSGGGHDDNGHDDGGHEDGGRPGGSGGQGASGGGEGEGRGGEAGRRGESGGRPVWAQEGIPEVELGRLNVARSPAQVIDRAFSEALASFTPEVAEFYRLDLDAMEKELSENWDNMRLVDSPLQNLALLRSCAMRSTGSPSCRPSGSPRRTTHFWRPFWERLRTRRSRSAPTLRQRSRRSWEPP